MAFTVSGSLAIDETTGTQNAADLGDSSGNDIAGGAGVLPSEFDAVLALEGASSATAIGVAVSGATADNSTGTDMLTGLGADVINLAFTDSAGNALDGDAAKFGPGSGDFLRTTDGTQIFLYTSVHDDNVVLGRKGTAGGLANPSGAVVFAAYLDTHTADPGDAGATGAKVWLVEYATILHGTAGSTATAHDDARFLTDPLYVTLSNRTDFSLEGAPSGQNLFLMFGDGTPSATEVAIVVTADNPVNQSGADPNSAADDLNISGGGTVNTGQGGGGTTLGHTNQMVDPGEGMYFTFVTGANPARTVPNLTQGTDALNGADVEANIDFTGLFAATGASFAIVQLQPPKATELTISAMNTALETKTDYIDGLGDADDVLVNINFVKVSTFVKDGPDAGHDLDAGPTATFTASGSNAATGITATFNANGTVTLSGIEANDQIEYRTGNSGGSLTHSRVLIEHTGVTANANSAFDIGKFSLVNASSNPQAFQALSFQDDGPTAAATLAAGVVRHDETVGNDGDADDVTGPIAAFSGVTVVSTDMTAAYAQGSASVIDSSTSSGGADGLASTAYSLSVSAAGVDSGLDTTEGQNILLFKEGLLVVGRISGGPDNGEAAFAVSINSSTGVLSLVQYHSIKHPTGGASHDESLSVANAALFAVATVTDGDGDTHAASVDIGANVRFQDDGPTAAATLAAGVVRHDETVGNDGDADDVTGPIAAFSGVTTASTDMTAAYAQGSASVIDSSTSTPGVDGIASTAYTLSVSAAGVDSGLDTTEGQNILLFKEGDLVVGRISGGADDGEAAFAVSINSSTGVLSLVQYHSIKHLTTGASHDESLSLTNAALFAVATVTDGDGDTHAASVDIGANVRFQDDGPTTSTNSTVLLDDDAVSGAGGNAGGSGDDADSANTSGTLGHAFGQDGAGTVAYLTTGAPTGFSYEASGTSLLIKQGTTTVLTLTMVAGTGAYTVAQNNPILHAAGSTENNQTFTVNYQVTDGDGDTASGTLGINVDDDTPVVTAKSNLVYANASNPAPGGTGLFDYSIGADARTTYSALSSDLTVALTGGTVGTNAITNMDVDWASEDALQAQFSVAFTYVSDPTSNTTTNATGTLTFDKVAGTYTLALAQPISSFGILSTATAQGFTGYLPNSSTIDNTQPEVTVAALANNFFVQFTGYSEPGGGVDNNAGNNNLDAIGINDAVTNPAVAGDDAFVNGEVFKQAASWASVSGTAAGVAGDTMQQGEVLDLDFFLTNPTGFSSLAPTATSSAIFLQFDALDNNEDLVVILKLVDSTNPASKTTKAVIADYNDIFHKAQAGSIPPAFGFTGTLDNNDGLVVIENQDYNGAGENWLIQGAQVLASTEGVSGTAINLNGAIGAGGASTTTQTFADATDTQNTLTGSEAGTWDGDVFKIVNIGFVTSVTPDAHLTFDVAVTDNDGDTTATQTLDVTISSGNTFTGGAAADAIQGSTGADTLTGGAGADVMTGLAGADQFVFATGASGITLATADTVTDFLTGVDKLATSKAAGAVTIADGGALADFAAFVTAANAVLTAGAGANDVYAAYNAAASGNAWVVVDENDTGSVDAGDTLVVLTGINLAGEIAPADFA